MCPEEKNNLLYHQPAWFAFWTFLDDFVVYGALQEGIVGFMYLKTFIKHTFGGLDMKNQKIKRPKATTQNPPKAPERGSRRILS